MAKPLVIDRSAPATIFAPPVGTITELAAIVAASREDRQQRLVEDEGSIFFFNNESTAGDADGPPPIIEDNDGVVIPNDSPATGRWIKIQSAIQDHNSLLNLTVGDVHTQYVLGAGRFGGQTLNGGTAVGDFLRFRGSSAASGVVRVNDLGGTMFVGANATASGSEIFHVDGDQFASGLSRANQLESLISDGISPLIVASTTVVVNLNADLLDGNHAAAFAAAVHTHPSAQITDFSEAVDDRVNALLVTPNAGVSGTYDDGANTYTIAITEDLAAIEALNSLGIATRTAGNTWAARTITGTANQVSVADGDGVSGNPTLSLPQNVHTGADFIAGRLSAASGVRASSSTPIGIQVNNYSLTVGSSGSLIAPIITGVPDDAQGGNRDGGLAVSTDGSFYFRQGGSWIAAGGTLDSAYDFGGPGAGRTITTDAGAVTLTGPSGLLIGTTVPSGVELLNVTGDAYISGKLTVVGAIDPVSLLLSGGTALFIESNDGNTAPVSSAGTGRMRYHSASGMWQVSVEGGDYINIATSLDGAAGGTLDDAYDFGGAGAGRTITTDAGYVTLTGPSGMLIGTTAPSGTELLNVDGDVFFDGQITLQKDGGGTYLIFREAGIGAGFDERGTIGHEVNSPAGTVFRITPDIEKPTELLTISNNGSMLWSRGGETAITGTHDFGVATNTGSAVISVRTTAASQQASFAVDSVASVGNGHFRAHPLNREIGLVDVNGTDISLETTEGRPIIFRTNLLDRYTIESTGNLTMEGDFDVLPATANQGEFGKNATPFLRVRASGIVGDVLEAATLISAQTSTAIAINVTNSALTVGGSGSLIAPVVEHAGAPTDIEGGDLDGGLAINRQTATLYFRSGATWQAVSGGGSGSDTTAFHQDGDAFGALGVLGTTDGFDMSIQASGVEVMRLFGTKKVAIGSTSLLDTEKFLVHASQNIDVNQLINNSSASGVASASYKLRNNAGDITSLRLYGSGFASGGLARKLELTGPQGLILKTGSVGTTVDVEVGSETLASFTATSGPTTKTSTLTSRVVITQPTESTGSPTALTLTGATHTVLDASTEAEDVHLNLARTIQFATGALTTQRAFRLDAPTYAFVGTSVITDAASMYISGGPIAGTNATITNSYALWLDSGLTRLDGDVQLGTKLLANSSTSIGLQVTNSALTVGGSGSLVMPVVEHAGAPTDGEAGNLDGGIALNRQEASLYFRSGGTWQTAGAGVTDHGALTGLSDDDHTIYSLADGARAFSGAVSGVTPTLDPHLTTKAYVDAVAASGGSLGTLIVVRAGPATGPSKVTKGDVEVFELPDGSTKDVVLDAQTSADFDSSQNLIVTFQYVITTTGAGNGDVRFILHGKYIADTEQIDKADDEFVTVDQATIDIADEMHSVSFTLDSSLIAANDRITLRMERIGADANDTYGGAIGVLQNAKVQ